MASVWRVRDEATDRHLALKRLTAKADAKHVALFEREYYTLASVRHPCIVAAYDYATDEGGPFYTMDLLAGNDLSDASPMPWVEACRVLRDVASGVAMLHARRLIHRDISARNVWRTPDGEVKLIDFGTMVVFGKAPDVAGTPPFVAPESLQGLPLDQRTDLYSLGALGYFLLTGLHAFPAKRLSVLPAMWKQRPRPASHRVAELKRADLPAVPPALDALIDALLSQDRMARPTSAADVIDRLTVIASLERDARAHVAESYLSSPAFVGRDIEREALRLALQGAISRKPACVSVESAAGLGRSRLLAELAIEAQLASATVLQAEPQVRRETHGTALGLALQLLDSLPEAALRAARPYAQTLGHVSPALRAKLGVTMADLSPMPHAHGEARMRVQAALRDWFLEVTRENAVVIVADDLEDFDEGSAAWLAALVHEASCQSLLVVAATLSDGTTTPSPSLQSLRDKATRIQLPPLAQAETFELFRSIFGDTQHLARLVDLVHQRAAGSPGLAMDLAEHLVREGVVSYVEGTWVLPQNIDPASLPANRSDADLARLERLPAQARSLGQVLGIRGGVLPLDMCRAISEIDGPELFEGLESLMREGVLVGSADGYRFARDSLRTALCDELDADRRRGAHRRLGRFLMRVEDASPLERLAAGVHLLQGGEEDEGSRVAAAAGKHYGLVELADLGPATPSLEIALQHFRGAARPLHELISVLSPLALAGYYADRQLAARYGDQALDALQTVLGLKLARRLRPWVGRKVSLFLAIAFAAIGFAVRKRNPRVPTLREAFMLFFNCVACLTGVSTICIDPAAGKRFASVLEPLTALGPNHIATFMHEFCVNLVATVRDGAADALARWQRMIDRLDRPDAVRDLPENVHALYLGGALYARGVLECLRDGSEALECATRLESLRLRLYDMSADQVRMLYYGNRGNLDEMDRYRRRVEVHAIQRGTAWQVETWAFSGLGAVYMRTEDVAGMKYCVEQLKRLSADVASLRLPASRAEFAYLVLRGTPADALAFGGEVEETRAVLGWSRNEGMRARACNAVGEHARARDICLGALARVDPADLDFPVLNLGLQIELARAEAKLGDVSGATERLDALLSRHRAGDNPLTLGPLHEASAEIAAMRGDAASVAAHVAEVERLFRPMNVPALAARCERLARQTRPSASPVTGDVPRRTVVQPPAVMTFVHRLRHGGDLSAEGSAAWIVEQLADFAKLHEAYLYSVVGDEVTCAARIGDEALEAVLAPWVAQHVHSANEYRTLATSTAETAVDSNRLEVRGKAYRLALLTAEGGGSGEIVGAVVLPDDSGIPGSALTTIAERLHKIAQQRGGSP
jgi:hypothetical protein